MVFLTVDLLNYNDNDNDYYISNCKRNDDDDYSNANPIIVTSNKDIHDCNSSGDSNSNKNYNVNIHSDDKNYDKN